MSEFGIETFTRMVVRKLEELKIDIILENPSQDGIFPCGVVGTILRNDIRTENGVPIRSQFYVSVEWWSDKLYTSLALYDSGSIKLRELNMTPSGVPSQRYDEITRKYIYGGSYEVRYNALTNALELIK